MKLTLHLRRTRPGVFGGTTTTSLCGRLRTLADGMNLTDKPEEVTCKFCQREITLRTPRYLATTGEK